MGLGNFLEIEKVVEKDDGGIHIAYGSFGSSIRFKMKEERWSGQCEYYKALQHLCSLEKITKVYVLSNSDYHNLNPKERETLDPNNKVVSCPKRFPFKKCKWGWGKDKYKFTDEEWADFGADDKFNWIQQMGIQMVDAGVRIDFGLFFFSQGCNTPSAIPGFLRTITKKHTRARVLDMTALYAAPLIDYVNRTGIPWFMLATDPRYVKTNMRPRDFVNLPKEILGQYNQTCKWECAKEYKLETEINMDATVEHIYSGIEKTTMIGTDIVAYDHPKTTRFTLVAAQVDGPNILPHRDFRFTAIKNWILDLDKKKEVSIYGKWNENRTEGWPQFKGFIATEDLDKIFTNTKYTLVMPTKAGWATSKPWEMIQLGVIPFFHSHYDNQNNMIPEDHFLRCKDPADFYKKMNILDADDKMRIELVKRLQETFISDGPDGSFLTKLINKTLTKHNLHISI